MLNKVMLIGNVVKIDPLRHIQSGTAVISFTVETERNSKTRDGNWQKTTTQHSVTAWGTRAERLATQLQPGTRVYVGGRIEYRTYQNNAGNTVNATTITVEEMNIVAGQAAQAQRQQQAPPPPPPPPPPAPTVQTTTSSSGEDSYYDENDDLPF